MTELVLPVNADWNDDDWNAVFDGGANEYSVFTAEPVAVQIAKRLDRADLKEITDFYTSSTDGNEPEIIAIIRLHDGRWASLVASADYTGWDCQSGVDWHIGTTRDDVIRYGLDNYQRERLGIVLPESRKR